MPCRTFPALNGPLLQAGRIAQPRVHAVWGITLDYTPRTCFCACSAYTCALEKEPAFKRFLEEMRLFLSI